MRFTREELLESGFSSPDDDVPLGVLLKRSLVEKDRKMTAEEKKEFEQEQQEAVVEMVVEQPKKRARVVKIIPNRCEFRGNKTRCTNQIAPGTMAYCAKHMEQGQEFMRKKWDSIKATYAMVHKIKENARKMRIKEWVDYNNERWANERATQKFKALMGL